MRRQRALSLSVQPHQRGPVAECHAQSPHPRVQLPVVPQEAAGLEGLDVVEAQLARHVAVGGELNSRDLESELVCD